MRQGINGVVLLAKARILSGCFYVQAMVLFLTAPLMALLRDYGIFALRPRLGRLLLPAGAEVLPTAERVECF